MKSRSFHRPPSSLAHSLTQRPSLYHRYTARLSITDTPLACMRHSYRRRVAAADYSRVPIRRRRRAPTIRDTSSTRSFYYALECVRLTSIVYRVLHEQTAILHVSCIHACRVIHTPQLSHHLESRANTRASDTWMTRGRRPPPRPQLTPPSDEIATLSRPRPAPFASQL